MTFSRSCKAVLDVGISFVALVLLLPVMAFVSLAILIVMGRPVLFRQVRPGLAARPFTLFKFRTMRSAVDECEQLLPDDQRLTWLGSILRKLSLDELPQLWNVLRGEMSLVGPRPLLLQYLDRYSGEQGRRHDVLPGLTGWAQIHGRNQTTWEERLALDVWYVDHWSLKLDLQILWRTMLLALARTGVSHSSHATMPEFLGNGPASASSRYEQNPGA